MARLGIVVILLTIAGVWASCSENADGPSCTLEKADAAALLQGGVAVQRMTGSLSSEALAQEEKAEETADILQARADGSYAGIIGMPEDEDTSTSGRVGKPTPKLTPKPTPKSKKVVTKPSAPKLETKHVVAKPKAVSKVVKKPVAPKVETKPVVAKPRPVKKVATKPVVAKAVAAKHVAKVATKPVVAKPVQPNAKTTIWFGGSSHRTWSGRKGVSALLRPENIKTMSCSLGKCYTSKCSHPNPKACWYGYLDGNLGVVVPPSASHSRYVADLWARCSNGGGQWKVCVSGHVPWVADKRDIVNGDLSVFLNGLLLKTFTQSGIQPGVMNCAMVPISGDSQIRIQFDRRSSSLTASADVFLEATGVDTFVDVCMGAKNCLAVLADGSDAAYALRNDNAKQMKCLAASDAASRNAISSKCAPWEQCLQTAGRKDDLLVFLRAGVGQVAASKTAVSAVEAAPDAVRMLSPGFNEAEACIDPSMDDPESWECECMEHMKKKCGSANEKCFHKVMCSSPHLCCAWKQTHCPALHHCVPSMIGESSASGNNASLIDRSRSATNTRMDDSLDQTLSGKCASQ